MSRAESSSIKDHRSREDLRGLSRERVRELLQYDEEDKDKKDKKDKKDEKDEEDEKDEVDEEDEKDEKNKEDKEGKKDKEDREDEENKVDKEDKKDKEDREDDNDNDKDKDKTHVSKIWLPLLHDRHIINQAPATQTSSQIFLIESKNFMATETTILWQEMRYAWMCALGNVCLQS